MSRILPKLSKLFFNFALVSILLLTSLSPVLAYTAPVPGTTTEVKDGETITKPARETKAGDGTLQGFQMSLALPEYNKESFDYQSLTGVMSGMATMLLGCTIQNNNGKVNYAACPESFRSGTVHVMGNAMASVVSGPPISGVEYLADLGQRLNLVQPAYAQTGYGFGAINPFLVGWRAVRNFAYLLLVIATVGFGIAIMLRTKISPQAVITIQSALPRLIIALIFITFSYAIVGLLVDFVYVIFGLLVWGLYASGLTIIDPAKEFSNYAGAGFFETVRFILGTGAWGAWDIIRSNFATTGIAVGGVGIAGLVGAVITGLIAIPATVPVLGGIAASAPIIAAFTIPVIIGLVIAVTTFFFRTFFALAKAYLLLLLHLIFAPLFILYAMTIGSGIWNGWLRGTVANILVFPFVGIIIFLALLLVNLIDRATGAGGNIWGPPYVGSNPVILKGMIGLGAIMLLPTIPDIINQFLGIRGGLPINLPQVGNQFQRIPDTITQAAIRKFFGPPPCMPSNSLINTLKGEIAIINLKVGDLVWSVNSTGEHILVAILSVTKRAVPTNHRLAHIMLLDGRELFASPPHPDSTGNPIRNLRAGDEMDSSTISMVELVEYKEEFVYDILPAGETGNYWANGVLIGSTLFKGKSDYPTTTAIA